MKITSHSNNKGENEVIAILPVGILVKKEYKDIRKIILKDHTLSAVITMPKDLFYPNASVNTAVVIFKSGIKYDFNKKVWFHIMGDGFILKKHKGRVDSGKWNEVKLSIKQDYMNKKVVDDSKNAFVKIDEDSEWIAESYIKVNFKEFVKKDIEQKVLDHNFLQS